MTPSDDFLRDFARISVRASVFLETRFTLYPCGFKGGGRRWIRTIEGVSQQIYSLPPLATWVSYHSLDITALMTVSSNPKQPILYRHSIPRNERSIRYRSISCPARIFRDKSQPSSKNGKSRSSPKVPCMLQYVSSGVDFARVKVSGKIIWQSLQTAIHLSIACSGHPVQGTKSKTLCQLPHGIGRRHRFATR